MTQTSGHATAHECNFIGKRFLLDTVDDAFVEIWCISSGYRAVGSWYPVTQVLLQLVAGSLKEANREDYIII